MRLPTGWRAPLCFLPFLRQLPTTAIWPRRRRTGVIRAEFDTVLTKAIALEEKWLTLGALLPNEARCHDCNSDHKRRAGNGVVELVSQHECCVSFKATSIIQESRSGDVRVDLAQGRT